MSEARAREVQVLLPLPLATAYDYRLPDAMEAPPGTFVAVPLGRRETVGVVWGPGTGTVEAARLKDVIAPLDAPPMTEELRRTVDWVAAYTLSPPGAVLRMAMSVTAALEAPKPVIAYRAGACDADAKLTPARRRVLAVLADGPPRLPGELAR
ncbi:MAG: primosomal protein N', partial [Alphaproteobacteria bacterium]|nr:primosomal protein N' [Alphaproteobacteria bacterium]